ETFRWTVVQQIHPETPENPPRNGKKPPKLPDLRNVVVLQRSYECSDCGKTFGCGSHFAKHRRTHTG
ncbi:ZSCA2 protein, partial [Paradoxornis webbianus]|nr:ZSCA2 protein [Sinosuthora webbiana]